jgi:pyrroloquinoline-quinone synthase
VNARDFEARLRRVGAERYHHLHPFNVAMHEGRLSPEALRCWVRNRYYYQTRIPIKDGILLAKAEDPAFRRGWIGRIHDHDGRRPGEGGLERWLDLAEAVGLERAEVASLRGVHPRARDACDAYVRFVESHSLLEAVASSLTELFAGALMRVRLEAFEKHYAWVGEAGLGYFRSRTLQAPADAEYGLRHVLEHARSAEDQQRCVAALERKCEILWSFLDAVEHALRRPRLAPHVLLRPDPAEPDGETWLAVLPERAVRVNRSGREILALCDGERSAERIAAEIRARHPEAEDAELRTHAFLDAIAQQGVLDEARA